MSGDGGGAFNASSAHPYENPSALSNVIEIVVMALIPMSLVRTYGIMVGDRRQGWALLVVVIALFGLGTAGVGIAESIPHGTVATAVGASAEGTEVRFGVPGSALFGQVATATADGAANSSYDSFASLGGGNTGQHGLSELLYAFTSCVAGNGSAFAGFSGNTPGLNLALSAAMLVGRYVPIILVLALAARFAGQRTSVIDDPGALPTHTVSFVGLMVGVVLIVVGLEYLPALALAPIAESLS
jgi:K+-transporting ATPase A subunit